jgi:hypothetical protein
MTKNSERQALYPRTEVPGLDGQIQVTLLDATSPNGTTINPNKRHSRRLEREQRPVAQHFLERAFRGVTNGFTNSYL